MRSTKQSLNSVLLIDDDRTQLGLVSKLLRTRTSASVVATTYPSEALALANKHFFDVICVDVTINFQGSSFGGLELYKRLRGRYGDSSLLAYSQFITEELLKEYEYDFNFVERVSDPEEFTRILLSQSINLRRRQNCFVAMPFDKRYSDLSDAIFAGVKAAGYRGVRVDRQHFTSSVSEKVLSGIRDAKFVVFVATDRNPNAFFECGYAVALEKEIVTVTDAHVSLPFDVRDRSAIAYGKRPSGVLEVLRQRLEGLTRVSA